MSDSPKRLTRVLSAMAIVVGLGAARPASRLPRAARHPPAQQVDQPQPGQDQGNADFTPPGEKAETPDQPGEAQKAESEPANDPEPNHQDPNGANVDHTPAGESRRPRRPTPRADVPVHDDPGGSPHRRGSFVGRRVGCDLVAFPFVFWANIPHEKEADEECC